MSINILFLYPNTFGMNMLPPAIALFSALLKQEGHKVELFDSTYYDVQSGIKAADERVKRMNVKPYDMGERGIRMRTTDWRKDLWAKVKGFKPDLIAISSTEDMWGLALTILEEIEDEIASNNIPVLAGGVFATFAPDLAINHRLIDMVCVGEGENTIVDLCDRINRRVPYDDITNTWIKKKDGGIIKNPISRPVDINENPTIDIGLFEKERLYRPMAGKVYRMLPVETIRGCPYKCAYCNSPSQTQLYKNSANSRFFRKKRADLIEKDLRHFVDEFKAEYFYFWADTFLAQNKDEFEEFCEIYSTIRKPFWMQSRPETLTDYHIKRLAEVGLHRMNIGIEHGNEEFRNKHLKRDVKNAHIIEQLKILNRHGIPYSVNNITGFPHETRELAMDTVELNRHIGSDGQTLFSFAPFHGTPLRKVCEDLGLINHETITKCLTNEAILKMPQYPIEEIEGLKKCFVLYVNFPKARWKDIRRAEANTPEGNRIFDELRQEFEEKVLAPNSKNPNGDQHNLADLEYGVTQS